MKHAKFKHLYEYERQARSMREIQPASPNQIEQWLHENVSDPEMRNWYRREVEKSGLVDRK